MTCKGSESGLGQRRRRQARAGHIISYLLFLLHEQPVRKKVVLYVAFRLHLHAKKSAASKKLKDDTETLYRWATVSGNCRPVCRKTSFYTSRDANLPGEELGV